MLAFAYASPLAQVVVEKKELSRGKQQTADSLVHLDKKKASTIDNVTAVRVEADNRENVRRIQEEEKRQERLRKLQEEALSSGKRNAAVEMRPSSKLRCKHV